MASGNIVLIKPYMFEPETYSEEEEEEGIIQGHCTYNVNTSQCIRMLIRFIAQTPNVIFIIGPWLHYVIKQLIIIYLKLLYPQYASKTRMQPRLRFQFAPASIKC